MVKEQNLNATNFWYALSITKPMQVQATDLKPGYT